MQKILVLFNLREGVDASDYESWARNTDLPTARQLDSVISFHVYRAEAVIGSGAKPPYEYAEWLEVTGLEELGADAQTEAMTDVVQAFGTYADNARY